jgi:phosphoglycolate phosphatase-like HAD superfamily hydrolase
LDRAFRPYKPAPEPILHICREWDFRVDEVLFIGDSKYA